MILKQTDDKSAQINELEHMISISSGTHQKKIEQELRALRAGIKAENEATYYIDFDINPLKYSAVIHDLRLEINGRVAQIDHLIIHRTLNIFVLETKNFHAGLRITEEGEFLRWNNFKKNYEGMASPLAQNERHITVLKDAFSHMDLPKRLGLRLSPAYHSYILLSTNARIDRPKKFDTSHIIKADMLMKTIDLYFDKSGFIDTLGNLSRLISKEDLKNIGNQLIDMHRPITFNYAAKFGITEPPKLDHDHQGAPSAVDPPNEKPKCRACQSHNLSIQHGKYGYYFKCNSCQGNTPIKISCGKDGHKERIRKEKQNFYRECAECQTSSLFFVNQE